MRQKVAALIVRLRIPLMILMLILAVLCGTTIRSVKVNYDLISYLDDDTAAMRGLAIMNSEFSGVSGMSVALKNGTEEDAQQTASWIAALDGVMLANHDAETGVKEHDGDTYRLIRVIANADNSDAVYDAIEAQLADTPHLISGGPKDNRLLQQNIGREMPIVMLVSCIIVLAVLLAMSRSWLEPFIFFLIIAVSILLNMGTNWIFPSISFVTFAVAAILQLALAMDYSIMLINAFERLRAQGLAPREAMTQALADSFMPIASSALTTVAGMLALVFMSFTIGFDIGIVLAKGIVLSMLTVFLLMPGVLVACSPMLDKTTHKPLHISGKLITRGARGVVPILLIALIVAGTILQFGNTYTYTVRDMDADSQLVSELFGQNNQIVLLFPTDTTDEGYQRQRDMLAEMQAIAFDGAPIVNSVQAMVTTGAQALEYYDVPKAAQLLGYSEQQVQMVFNQLGVTDSIRADALIERLISLAKRFSMLVPKAAMEQLNQAETLLNTANSTFNGAHYARALLSLNLAISSPYAHDAVQQIEAILYKYYGEDGALSGMLVAMDDIATSFTGDMARVSLITIGLVFLIVMISFRSLVIPAMLVCLIQGAVYINMAFSGLVDGSVFFMCYLICVALQMGATIDYGILLTSHYRRCRSALPPREAVAQAMQMSLQTILTSGLALITAGFAVGKISTVFYISSIGTMLARGAVVSVLLILFLLPQLLIWLDRWMIKKILKRRNFLRNRPFNKCRAKKQPAITKRRTLTMTAKIVSILLALLTLISGTAAASFDPETDLQTQHGYILEMLDDGSFLLLNQDNQTVQVNTDENTVTDLAEPLHAGQYVVVDYDGKLTRSLPAQLYAQHIFGATLKGIVSAVNEREVTLIEDETQQEYIVHLPEDVELPTEGEHIAVHFNGVIALSLPAQLSALAWDVIPDAEMRAE